MSDNQSQSYITNTVTTLATNDPNRDDILRIQFKSPRVLCGVSDGRVIIYGLKERGNLKDSNNGSNLLLNMLLNKYDRLLDIYCIYLGLY